MNPPQEGHADDEDGHDEPGGISFRWLVGLVLSALFLVLGVLNAVQMKRLDKIEDFVQGEGNLLAVVQSRQDGVLEELRLTRIKLDQLQSQIYMTCIAPSTKR